MKEVYFMDEKERKNIINVLRRARIAIKRNDVPTLKLLSDRTIHSSSIRQDSDYVLIAVAMYALYKIFGREDYRKYEDWKLFYKTVISNLKQARLFLLHKNEGGYERCVKNILKVGSKLESNLKGFIKDVIEMAKISKGSRVYEHGISLGRSAELLGVSEFELLEYAGKTGISDVKLAYTEDIEKRLKFARGLFK